MARATSGYVSVLALKDALTGQICTSIALWLGAARVTLSLTFCSAGAGSKGRRQVALTPVSVSLSSCRGPTEPHHDIVCLKAGPARRVVMTVADILRSKGTTVKTVRPDETALELAEQLRAARIGAAIVSHDGSSIDGIISERDLAYGLAAHGSKLPSVAVEKLMTKVVVVCSPEDTIVDIMGVMTQRRIRHLPVKNGDQLIGIISIGDVLKHRLGEMQLEANVLRDYAIVRR